MSPSSNPDHPVLQRLQEIRHALLRLHKSLLDAERERYEQTHGRVTSPGQLLKLVIENPEFDYLHRLSELVVAIDEAAEDKQTALTPDAAHAFIDQASELLTNPNSVFGHRYFPMIQDPAIANLHGELKNLISATRG